MYGLLNLRTYFTSGETETKAWTIKQGMLAPQAAGVIHSDFETGVIRAETVRMAQTTPLRSIRAETSPSDVGGITKRADGCTPSEG